MTLAIRQDESNIAIMKKVVIDGDLSKLTEEQQLRHYDDVCRSLQLNPKTRPFGYIRLNNKLVLYALKDCSEQLRNIHKISLKLSEPKIIEGNYIITAYAQTPDGRVDSSTGVVNIANLKGDAFANAMMKAETKAKRRVTLSICGLGLTDESEIETIKNAKRVEFKNDYLPVTDVQVTHVEENIVEAKEAKEEKFEDEEVDHGTWEFRIEAAPSVNELEKIYKELRASSMKKFPKLYTNLIDLVRNCQKKLLETGEVDHE